MAGIILYILNNYYNILWSKVLCMCKPSEGIENDTNNNLLRLKFTNLPVNDCQSCSV
jgi:hypothetical protein